MKVWILRILASLLTASLCGAILTIVLNHTILNAHYLEGQFTAVNGYSRLSAALSNDVAQQAGLSDVPQATSVIQGVLTQTVVTERVNSALEGLQTYLQGKGSAPTVNFSDLGTQAQALGIPLQQNSDLFQPVTIGPSGSGKNHVELNLRGINMITVLTSVLLTVLLLVLSWRWRRYKVLPGVLISVGVTMAILAIVAYVAIGQISNYIKLSSGSDAFVLIGRDLAQHIGRDLACRFGSIAAVCLVIGIVTRVWAARLQKRVEHPLIPSQAVATIANNQ